MNDYYVGLMSGTSLDGADAVLADFAPANGSRLKVLAHAHCPLPTELRAELLALSTVGDNELHRAALAANELSRVYAHAVSTVLELSGVAPESVQALGAHGQTLRHHPGEFDAIGYSLQLLNPALLAELTDIDVVADFRGRDLAARGQGAPLVPAFHRSMFSRPSETVAVLNLGGISNLSVLKASGDVSGFDCGPGNLLMDHWCRQHIGQPYDNFGSWAATGQVVRPLFDAMLTEAYFGLPPPKSTGRELFNPSWLASHMQSYASARPQDIQASLAELTAYICARDVQRYAEQASELVVCGGGASNRHVMQRIAALLPGHTVLTSDALGLPAPQVEAAAFAWLARAFIKRLPGNLPSVTGAIGARVLGALYPAR